MGNSALIIIDVQNFYFKGDYRLKNPEKAAKNIKMILDDFRKNNKKVFFIKHCFENVDNNDPIRDIYDGVKPLKDEKIIMKYYPSSFLKTSLKEELDKNNITDLCIVGMMTHMCVDTTTRACQDYGYNVTLIDDACATKDLTYNNEIIDADTVHKVYMTSLNGMFCNVLNTADYLAINK